MAPKDSQTQEKLTEIEQLALQALLDHFEPTDHHLPHYHDGAIAVVEAVSVPIQVKAIRVWAQALGEYLDQEGRREEVITPQDLLRRADEIEADWNDREGHRGDDR